MSLFSNSNELESWGDSFVWWRVLLSLVLLSILIVVSCASALYAPFQSDDERNITANPLVWSFDNYSRNSIFEYRQVTFLPYALN